MTSSLGRFSFAAAALLVATTAPLRAQDLRASVAGRVSDATGSSVPRARVVVANLDTNLATTTETNDVGRYVVLFLQPGRYTLTVEAAGFKSFVRENLVLGSSEKAGLDVTLEVGQLAERITVTAEAPLLNTETASRGSAIIARQIVELPNNGRNIYQFAWAAPGLIKASRSYGSMDNIAHSNASDVSINGGFRGENESVLDGVTNTQPITRNVTFMPPLESVAEINVQTNNYDAAYGRLGGGVVALTTKSGANAFHGTLFEFYRGSALAANTWQANFLGSPKTREVNNNFGFHVDGPIWLPKLFDGRNRMFFMLSYDATRSRGVDTESAVMADAAMRAGDFSGIPLRLYDPLTTTQQGANFVRQPFAGNRVPANRINPVSRKVLEFVPLPNLTGRAFGQENYANFGGAGTGYDQFLGKLDYRINDANNVYFSYGRTPYQEIADELFDLASPAETSRSNPTERQYFRWAFDWTSTINARTVLNFRWGMARYRNTRGSIPAIGYDPRQLGFADSLVRQFTALNFPRFDIGPGRYTSIGSSIYKDLNIRESSSYQLNLNRSQGRHQLKFGAEFRLFNENTVAPGNSSGYYVFTKDFTQANPLRGDSVSGDEFASFLLGYPTPGSSRVDTLIDPARQSRYYVAFVQDDFKLHPRVTLNLGFRWDYERPYAERYNRMVRGFAFDTPSPIAAAVRSSPALANCPACANLRGGLLFAGSSQRLGHDPDKNNFQPRIGVAVQLSAKWVLRGGYGLSYMGTLGPQASTGFSTSTTVLASSETGLPRASLENAFPDGLLRPPGSSQGLATLLGQGVGFGFVDRVVPYTHQFSFGIERAVRGNMTVEAAYSGNQARKFPGGTGVGGVGASLNVIPADQLGRPDTYYTERIANPLAGLLPLNPVLNAATVQRQSLMVPFPQYSGLSMGEIPIGKNHYHSLQTRLVKRYSRGMTLSVSYTVSKNLEEIGFLNSQDFNLGNPEASRLDKVISLWDAPQKLAGLWTYELPVGSGKPLGAGIRGPLSRLVSGWQINVNAIVQSGFPINFPNAPPLEARSAKLPASQMSVFNAFDRTLFPSRAPSPYTLRNWSSRFPDVRKYPLKNVDFGLTKKTVITERVTFEFRAEFLNAANHPWFSETDSQAASVTSSRFGWFERRQRNDARIVALGGRLSW